ncbi:hypothetical protein RHECNPAF_2330040 [Rhizobium etli CNPAF512]|nr:hypothetical protein RHECNPAF_2330040 [Rhizobium etli CNPAF512]
MRRNTFEVRRPYPKDVICAFGDAVRPDDPALSFFRSRGSLVKVHLTPI